MAPHRSGRRKTFSAKVFRNTLAATDVSVLQLRLPAGQRARFKAGQYLQVELPDGSRRAYSMANPPHESDTIQVHIRHVVGGQFTQIVSTLKAGDLLKDLVKKGVKRPVTLVWGCRNAAGLYLMSAVER